MSQERKKAEIKPAVTPVVPKKRETVEPKVVPAKIETPKVVEETPVKEDKKRKSDFKTLRIAMGTNIEERKQIADRVSKGELSFAYYAVDGDNGYHYYYINKN
jgi:hypothetical protein